MAISDMAQKIKELRKLRNMTLEDVANIVGVGKSTVRKWETGMIANMRRDKIAALARALETTPAYLMGWEEETPNTNTPFLSPAEQQLIDNYRQLNDEGQEKLLDLSADLVASGRYIKSAFSEMGSKKA